MPLLRPLLKSPGFTAVAVLTLGLGIGLVSTQFTLIDGVLLRPLPFPDAGRLYFVGRENPGGNGDPWRPITAREFLDHQERQSTFEDLAAFQESVVNLSHPAGPPSRVDACAVSANFLPLLSVAPQAGRLFAPGEDRPGQPLRVILGDPLWRQEFGADPGVVGRSVRLNGELATVIGVLPAGFHFPNRQGLWTNLRLARESAPGERPILVAAMGRVKPGVTPAAAREDLEVIAAQNRSEADPADRRTAGMTVRPFPMAFNNAGTLTLLAIMQAMTVLVLVLACVNVAGLLHVRATGRLRELAIRAALGAGRGRILRQLLLESLVIAGLGAGVGLALAGVGARLLEHHVGGRVEMPSWIHFDINPRVLAFTVLVAGAAGVLAGWLPALRASRIQLSEALKDDSQGSIGRRDRRLGPWLVAAQVAFAGGLVVVATLLALSAIRSGRVPLSFDPDSLLMGRLELHGPDYEDPAARVRFYNALVASVQRIPGVAAAAVSSRDLVNQAVYSPFDLQGAAPDAIHGKPGGWLEVVSRDYFRLIRRGAIAGRLFGPEDTSESVPVALVNESFAARYWPGQDAIGRRLRRNEPDAPWATVVGIVPDLEMSGVGNTGPAAGWYLLQDQQAWGWLDLLVRTEGDPESVVGPVREAVAALDRDQPIHTVATLRARTDRRIAGLQIVGTMAVVFATAALVLAAVGIYGVTAFTVRRRTREFGVRLALGATAGGIVRLLFRQNVPRLAAGIIAGLGLGCGLAMPLATELPKVETRDPVLYLVAAVLLAGVALLALWIPACRAARVDPLSALRSE